MTDGAASTEAASAADSSAGASAGPPARGDERTPWLALGAIGLLAAFNALWRLGTPDWKVDESLDGAYAWQAVRHGDWSLEDGHPVAVRWLMGFGQMAFGEGRVGIRVAGALASIAAVALLYLVGRRLHSRRAGLVAAAAWAILPRALVLGDDVVGPLRGDRFGYLEPFMVVALLGATWTGWNWSESGRLRDAAATGLLIGVGTAFKPTAVVVLAPVLVLAWWRRRDVLALLPGAAAMVVLAAVVLPLSYLPLGTLGPGHLRELIDYQLEHARTGHRLVVDGELTTSQPRTSHLLYQWRGMGWAACVALLIGAVGAWTSRRRRLPIAFATGVWATLFAFHLLSSVALPHYYVLWAPFSVLVASMGLVELLDRGLPAGADDGDAAEGSASLGERWRRAPGPVASAVVAGVLLAGAGLAGTLETATVTGGDYAEMVAALEAAGVEPTVVRYQGEAVDRYFPDADAGQVGFSDATVPFDLLVLDDRDVPMLPEGIADDLRAQAQANGLVAHRVGRLELWYADPS